MGVITLHRGDITTDAHSDATVNAANRSLLGGAGHGEPALLASCPDALQAFQRALAR